MQQNRQEIADVQPRFRPWDMLVFVVWFGVLAGLAEIAFFRTRPVNGSKAVYLRCHMMWMSPAANVVVLGIMGLAVLLLVRRMSRPMAVRITFAVLASVVFVNTLVLESAPLSGIYFPAKVILAIGMAAILQRLVARRTQVVEKIVRHTTIGLVLLVLFLTMAVGGWQHVKERRIIANLSDAPPSAPNVLLIVWDTVRAESLSLYGYERETTPYLEDLAKEGTVFQNAIAPSSWTVPSHASFFTGRFPYETLMSEYRTLNGLYPTLAEALSSRGYVTGGFVANTSACRAERGFARGFSHYEDHVASAGEFARNSALIRFVFRHPWVRRLCGYYDLLGRKRASRITNDFLRWVDHLPSGRPYFAFLNYFDAHEPYLPPADFARRFGRVDNFLGRWRPVRCLPSNMTAEEIESMRNAYDGSIAYLDYDLNRLFHKLMQDKLFDRTLVILVSDHGEEFGEHDTFGHGQDLHVQSIRVPLILRLPGTVPADVIVRRPVTLRDLPATVIGLLGMSDDGLFPGWSLERFWLEPGAEEPEDLDPVLSQLSRTPWAVGAPVAKGDMTSLIVDDMHYIRNGDGTEEVYDLRHDPTESDDLIRSSRGVEAAAHARDILTQMTR